jgi:hypothetical protein
LAGAGYRFFRELLKSGGLQLVRHQRDDEEEFLYSLAIWVVEMQPKLHDLDRGLTKTHETARYFEPLGCGELFGERWVVQYRPEDSHLKLIVRRRSERQKRGLDQALFRGDLHEYHRRAALLPNYTKEVTLVGHRPLKISADVAARRQAEGEDPDAFKALVLDALRQLDHQRLSPLKMGSSPKPPLFGHRKFDAPPQTSVHEVAMAIGLPLAQEGLLADETVKPLLMTAMGVPASLLDSVWERLKLHYSDSQYPLSLRTYIKRVVNDLCPRQKKEVFWDSESGAEYWPVWRAAQELKVQVQQERERWTERPKPQALTTNKTTLYRWIKAGVLPAKEFSYQTRGGVWRKDWAVAQLNIERLRDTHICDEGVIILLCKAHHIGRPSAERQYRRICQRLDVKASVPIKSDEEKNAIMAVLAVDPKVERYQGQRRLQVAQEDEQDVTEDVREDAVWADIHKGYLRLREAP